MFAMFPYSNCSSIRICDAMDRFTCYTMFCFLEWAFLEVTICNQDLFPNLPLF